jgi:chromosome segregation ATPase
MHAFLTTIYGMQALDKRALSAEASAAEGAARLKAEVQNRRRLEEDITNIKLQRARAVRDGEAAAMRESCVNEAVKDLELRLGLREEEIRGLKENVGRLQSMLALEKEVVGRLKPLEGMVAAGVAEIEALKMKVSSETFPVQCQSQVHMRGLGEYPSIPHMAGSHCCQ